MATGASFEVLAEASVGAGYRLAPTGKRPPKAGSVVIDSAGRNRLVRGRLFGWVRTTGDDALQRWDRWSNRRFGALLLEPLVAVRSQPVPWTAIALVVGSRLLLLALISVMARANVDGLWMLWVLMGLILATATYTAITLVHRAQWDALAEAMPILAPDWIPRLSRDVGGTWMAGGTLLGYWLFEWLLGAPSMGALMVVAMVVLDVFPPRQVRPVTPVVPRPGARLDVPNRRLKQRICHSVASQHHGLSIWSTSSPERLFSATEALIHDGKPWALLGPDPEFLPGTIRSNFGWDGSDAAGFHCRQLMELVSLPDWEIRFGNRLDYVIGSGHNGLSDSEACLLQLARALAQGAETLILVDALAPLSAERQWQVLDRLQHSALRICVVSSLSDQWGFDVIDLDSQ